MDLRHQTANFVNASWSLVDLRDLIYDMVGLLFTALSEHGGMAGDDDAGRAFAAVYKPAVKAVFDAAGHAHQAMAGGAGALLKGAEDFLKHESKIAAELLQQMPSAPGIGSQPAGPDCTPRASHKAEDLPEVVGETSWSDQYLLSRRFHGQRDKLHKVAGSWRTASEILGTAYWDSDGAWRTATLDQAGEAADSIEAWFKKFVGKSAPSSRVGDDETLLANLPAACTMLANACDAYADHIDTAVKKIPEEDDPFFGDPLPIWERPALGGEGHDGGLHALVADDTRISSLGHIPHALDKSQRRVKIPKPDDGGGFLPPVPPFITPLIRTPLLVPINYRPAKGPRVQPIPPPTPPDPRFPGLTGSDRKHFHTWLDSLRTGDVSGGKPAEVAYQKRIAGYPEFEVPIPPGLGKSNTLMVDGFRDFDGMAVEAKYVNSQSKCYRTLEGLAKSRETGKKTFLYASDRKELEKYAAALKDPRNSEMRGVETVTNNQDSVGYWRVMMAAYGIKGYARYEP